MTLAMFAGLAVICVETLAAVAIAVQAIIRVTRMNHCTRGGIVLGWLCLGSASVAVLVDVLAGKTQPSIYSALLMLAVAALVWLDRRSVR